MGTAQASPGVPALNVARRVRTEAAPVPALHTDWDVDLAHHLHIPFTHVTRATLDQVRAEVARSRQPSRIVKDAAIAAVRGVPGNVARTL